MRREVTLLTRGFAALAGVQGIMRARLSPLPPGSVAGACLARKIRRAGGFREGR